MSNTPLLPHSYKKIGWLLLITGLVLGIWYLLRTPEYSFFSTKMFAAVGEEALGKNYFFKIIENNILDELIAIVAIIGALIVAFTKETIEDEFIQKMRLDSLMWATIISYAVLVLIILFVYDISFFTALLVNMLTIPIIFIARFKWLLHRSKIKTSHAE